MIRFLSIQLLSSASSLALAKVFPIIDTKEGSYPSKLAGAGLPTSPIVKVRHPRSWTGGPFGVSSLGNGRESRLQVCSRVKLFDSLILSVQELVVR